MDLARNELSRMTAYRNPYAWSTEDEDVGLEHHSYYLRDRLGRSTKTGDGPLHRLLALHATPTTVQNFLSHAQQHQQRIQEQAAALKDSSLSSTRRTDGPSPTAAVASLAPITPFLHPTRRRRRRIRPWPVRPWDLVVVIHSTF